MNIMNKNERIIPLTIQPHIFVGQKPAAVMFGEERVDVKTWREVYATILKKCCADPKQHEMLMFLRGRAAGKVRAFLAVRPDDMRQPVRIADELYGETHYGSQTLMHILVNRILIPAGFDCYSVSIVLKGGR